MTQGGFQVDKEGLSKAIEQLEDARDKAQQLAREANNMVPGELTAKDETTGQAREVFKQRISGPEGSLWFAASDIGKKLQEKIDSYKAVLGEYEKAEDNADAATRNTERQS
ncbi:MULTISPECIES: hypothetical protein [unclassified Actinopolyspora]|uniref:hypothetical protein n=1 Tax=unclassified Actinopolyspora TaxID=2639451 RepID=UPI0013F67C9B|nr:MULTISPECIES: hypothetical protein [unclassified Actinopolyspora]NHD19453.1 hypothetical protein [Actinopolyspora sp. BKK2]NHE77393.1 hypothetical protein [Actinopolyspora sp. BKK1]